VIEAAADDEAVWNLKASEIDGDLDDAAYRAVE
jgi:hypothetical protein